MNKEKLVKTLKTNIPLWNRYRRCFPCGASTLIDLRGVDLRGADLRRTNLRGVDLRGVDLRGVDLQEADLRWANLRGAALDYFSLPLWCGSFYIKVGTDFTEQLLLHIYKLDSDHPEFKQIKEFIEPYVKNCTTVIKHNIRV